MNKDNQLEIYNKMDKELIDLTKKKQFDYGKDADVLSNFKSVSNAAKELEIDVHNPTGYALFMVLLKIARLSNLLNSGKTPNNEAIDDSFFDGINYFKLAYCTFVDEKK